MLYLMNRKIQKTQSMYTNKNGTLSRDEIVSSAKYLVTVRASAAGMDHMTVKIV